MDPSGLRRWIGRTAARADLVMATKLLELLRQIPRSALATEFSFRKVRPIFETAPFVMCGLRDPAAAVAGLWAAEVEGGPAMHATATLP